MGSECNTSQKRRSRLELASPSISQCNDINGLSSSYDGQRACFCSLHAAAVNRRLTSVPLILTPLHLGTRVTPSRAHLPSHPTLGALSFISRSHILREAPFVIARLVSTSARSRRLVAVLSKLHIPSKSERHPILHPASGHSFGSHRHSDTLERPQHSRAIYLTISHHGHPLLSNSAPDACRAYVSREQDTRAVGKHPTVVSAPSIPAPA